MPKLVVINADDLGLSRGTNNGIARAHKEGLLTSASIMPTGPAYKEAVSMTKRLPKLGIGVHLSLTLGKSILTKQEIPDLIDNNRYFYSNSVILLLKTIFLPGMSQQIRKEFKAQIDATLRSGITIDHLNSQYHVHFMPKVFPILTSLAAEYKIPFVRVPIEPFFLYSFPNGILKWFLMRIFGMILAFTHKLPGRYPVFYGILHTRNMDEATLIKTLYHTRIGISEILSHPGCYDLGKTHFDFTRQGIVHFLKSPARTMELKSLITPSLKYVLKKHQIRLVSFREARDILTSKI